MRRLLLAVLLTIILTVPATAIQASDTGVEPILAGVPVHP